MGKMRSLPPRFHQKATETRFSRLPETESYSTTRAAPNQIRRRRSSTSRTRQEETRLFSPASRLSVQTDNGFWSCYPQWLQPALRHPTVQAASKTSVAYLATNKVSGASSGLGDGLRRTENSN